MSAEMKLSPMGTVLCARWLSYCMKAGWPKEDWNKLQELWLQYHDEEGNLRCCHHLASLEISSELDKAIQDELDHPPKDISA